MADILYQSISQMILVFSSITGVTFQGFTNVTDLSISIKSETAKTSKCEPDQNKRPNEQFTVSVPRL